MLRMSFPKVPLRETSGPNMRFHTPSAPAARLAPDSGAWVVWKRCRASDEQRAGFSLRSSRPLRTRFLPTRHRSRGIANTERRANMDPGFRASRGPRMTGCSKCAPESRPLDAIGDLGVLRGFASRAPSPELQALPISGVTWGLMRLAISAARRGLAAIRLPVSGRPSRPAKSP